MFDSATGLILEIRAYHAAAALKDVAGLMRVQGIHLRERVSFDYAGRGYHLRWK